MALSIYGLTDPRTDEVRYIGKTSQALSRRLAAHLWPRCLRNRTAKARWLRELKRLGLKPEIISIEEHQTDAAMNDAERFLIAYFRYIGARLTNETDGGDGFSRGHKLSSVSIAQRASKLRGRKGVSPSIATRRLAARAKGLTPFCDQHGRRYETLAEAAAVAACSVSAVCMVLRGRLPHVHSYMFKFLNVDGTEPVFRPLRVRLVDKSGRTYSR